MFHFPPLYNVLIKEQILSSLIFEAQPVSKINRLLCFGHGVRHICDEKNAENFAIVGDFIVVSMKMTCDSEIFCIFLDTYVAQRTP